MQRNTSLFASFSALYLCVSDILLTHTHTHSHRRSDNTLNVFTYARVRRGVTPIGKGLREVPFVRFFMSFCQAVQEGNNAEYSPIK